MSTTKASPLATPSCKAGLCSAFTSAVRARSWGKSAGSAATMSSSRGIDSAISPAGVVTHALADGSYATWATAARADVSKSASAATSSSPSTSSALPPANGARSKGTLTRHAVTLAQSSGEAVQSSTHPAGHVSCPGASSVRHGSTAVEYSTTTSPASTGAHGNPDTTMGPVNDAAHSDARGVSHEFGSMPTSPISGSRP